MLAKHFGQCHVSSVAVFVCGTQAPSGPNVLDCRYGLALKSCCEAVGGVAPISLRVRSTDAAYGTRRAQLA
jgi:hypothetical protein